MSEPLTPAQEERYARHLLLDGWEGAGQELLLAASVRVVGKGSEARWAARYLAASGVGGLRVEVPEWREELLSLQPDLRWDDAPAHRCDPGEALDPCGAARAGAEAALALVRALLSRQS